MNENENKENKKVNNENKENKENKENDKQNVNLNVENKKDYELPDGTLIKVNDKQVDQLLSNCGEMMFNPNEFDVIKDNPKGGIAHLIIQSVAKCDKNIQNDLYSNIVLAGGNCMLNGIDSRLIKEITALTVKDCKINIANNNKIERKYSAWIGAKIFCQSADYKDMLITKSDYQEHGAKIVDRKCL